MCCILQLHTKIDVYQQYTIEYPVHAHVDGPVLQQEMEMRYEIFEVFLKTNHSSMSEWTNSSMPRVTATELASTLEIVCIQL